MQPLAVAWYFRSSILTAACIVSIVCGDVATAQTRRPRQGAPGSVQELNNRADDLERDYLTGLLELAGQYEEAGEIDKAREALRTILRLKPDTEAVKERLRAFDEAVFDANSTMVEVDAARGWMTTGVAVTRDQPIRLSAEGSYRFIVNDTVGPGGFSTENKMQDMAGGVPAGALMGMIAPPPRQGQRQPPEPGPPFAIGSEVEFKPQSDGVLLLRVNTPPGSRCIGKLRVEIRGNISPAP